MSSLIYQPQIDVYRKRQNLLNSGICTNENYRKTFDCLSEFEQKQIFENLKFKYSLILFDHCSSKDSINTKIEEFSQKAFDINLPIHKIVEIHLDLIDNLERQLMLEGLHADYLSDFRLTLIDVIAHLGELYRKCYK